MDWITHEEDVWFDFRGSRPEQLTPGRFYRGSVDGFADFGVFVDLCPQVTGLLHRSELDRRLESLDWEPGDTVFVQVTNVRDNGNVDLAWSIRQSEREFRGAKIHDPDGEDDGKDIETADDDDDGPVRHVPQQENGREGNAQAADDGTETTDAESAAAETEHDVTDDVETDAESAAAETEHDVTDDAETDADTVGSKPPRRENRADAAGRSGVGASSETQRGPAGDVNGVGSGSSPRREDDWTPTGSTPHDATSGPDRDSYCGSCTHFEYVQTDEGMQPYCAFHGEVMDDMDACEEYTPRK